MRSWRLPLCVFLASANAVLAQIDLPGVTTSSKVESAASIGKPLTVEYWLKEAQLTNATQAVYEQAIQASDTAVAEAAEYNLLHIPLAGANGPAIEGALRKLETAGDEFTIHWLEILARRSEPDLFWPQLLARRTRIEKRLPETAPPQPEKRVRERLLRAVWRAASLLEPAAAGSQ